MVSKDAAAEEVRLSLRITIAGTIFSHHWPLHFSLSL